MATTTQSEIKTAPARAGSGRDASAGKRRRAPRPREKSEFDQSIIDLARVTRVTRGGKQMSFRAMIVIGDRKGRVGIGMGKGQDVTIAINKAVNQAKKKMVRIPINEGGTIPYNIKKKLGASVIMMRPAPTGTGIIAGGVMRMIFELGGVKNVVAKIYGAKNRINNAKATIDALALLETKEYRKNLLA